MLLTPGASIAPGVFCSAGGLWGGHVTAAASDGVRTSAHCSAPAEAGGSQDCPPHITRQLLAYFVSRRGCALARNDVLDAVWGASVIVTPRSIDRCVATLRSKIEPDPHNPAYIQTIRDIGYRFEVE